MTVFSRLVPGDVASVRAQLQGLSRDDLTRLQDELNAMDDAVAARFAGMTRLYHGAPPRIAEAIHERGFALTKGRRSGFLGSTHEVDNLAIFLTENKALAAAFGANRTDRYGENAEVLEVYADLHQPLDMTTWARVPKPLRVRGEAILRQKRPKQEDLFWLVDQPAFVNAVRDLGYDAIRFTESAETVKALGLSRKGEVTVAVFDPARLHVAPPPRGSLGSLLWHLEHTEPPMSRRNPDPTTTSASSATKGAAFRRWFGDSKVVDARGEPLVVYHGSDDPDIEAFRSSRYRYFPALFFTNDNYVAGGYGEEIYSVYLRIERPLVVDAAGADWALIPKTAVKMRAWAAQDREAAREFLKDNSEGRFTSTDVLGGLAQALGFDGAIIQNVVDAADEEYEVPTTVYIVFDPRQIKSAKGNAGTFDPDDDNIYRNPRRNGRGGTAADRTDPDLWEAVKREVTAGNKGGKPGQWSARKAQLSVALYQQRGGGYYGPKDPRNSLAKWTREKWRTKSGRPSLETGERYLPTKAIAALTDAEYAATTRAKRAGMRKGQQFVPQPEDVALKVRAYRKNPIIDAGDIAKSLAAREPHKRVDLPDYGIVWTDTPEGDDSFPPAIASYAPKDGWLFYKGRNGSEGVIVGSLKDVQKWMLDVDAQLERYPLATVEPWDEAKHGGADHVASAAEAARIVFAKFGHPLRRVEVLVSTDPMAPSHPMGVDGISLTNVHRPVKAHFLADRKGTREVEVPWPAKVGAHEASHVGFGLRNDRAHYVIEVLKARQAAGKPYLSDYHSSMGHAEGAAEAGAFYTLLPDLLHEVAPEVHAAVAWWFGDGPDPRQRANPARRAREAQPEDGALKVRAYRKNRR